MLDTGHGNSNQSRRASRGKPSREIQKDAWVVAFGGLQLKYSILSIGKLDMGVKFELAAGGGKTISGMRAFFNMRSKPSSNNCDSVIQQQGTQ